MFTVITYRENETNEYKQFTYKDDKENAFLKALEIIATNNIAYLTIYHDLELLYTYSNY